MLFTYFLLCFGARTEKKRSDINLKNELPLFSPLIDHTYFLDCNNIDVEFEKFDLDFSKFDIDDNIKKVIGDSNVLNLEKNYHSKDLNFDKYTNALAKNTNYNDCDIGEINTTHSFLIKGDADDSLDSDLPHIDPHKIFCNNLENYNLLNTVDDEVKNNFLEDFFEKNLKNETWCDFFDEILATGTEINASKEVNDAMTEVSDASKEVNDFSGFFPKNKDKHLSYEDNDIPVKKIKFSKNDTENEHLSMNSDFFNLENNKMIYKDNSSQTANCATSECNSLENEGFEQTGLESSEGICFDKSLDLKEFKTSNSILINCPIEWKSFQEKMMELVNPPSVKYLYKYFYKMKSFDKSFHTKYKIIRIFFTYYSYLNNLLDRCDKCLMVPKTTKVLVPEKFTILESIDNLRSLILDKNVLTNMIENSKILLYTDDLEKLQKIISDFDFGIEKEGIAVEINLMHEKVISAILKCIILKIPKKVLEIFVLREIQKLPKGLDTFILTLAFINNLFLNNDRRLEVLFKILYIYKRFFKDSIMKNDEYLFLIEKFIGIFCNVKIDKMADQENFCKKLLRLRLDLQNGEDVADKLICLLGIIFPHNMNFKYFKFAYDQHKFIDQSDYNINPLSHLYKAPTVDVFNILKRSNLC